MWYETFVIVLLGNIRIGTPQNVQWSDITHQHHMEHHMELLNQTSAAPYTKANKTNKL